MNTKNLLLLTALAEGGMALAFLLLPSLPSELLFGQTPQTALTVILGRYVGAVLLSLSAVCWFAGNDARTPIARSVVKAMLFYDVVAGVLLLYARFALGLGGVLLWVGVTVHVALGFWCVVMLRTM